MTAAPGPLGRFVSRLKMKVFIASVLLLVCANLSLQDEATAEADIAAEVEDMSQEEEEELAYEYPMDFSTQLTELQEYTAEMCSYDVCTDMIYNAMIYDEEFTTTYAVCTWSFFYAFCEENPDYPDCEAETRASYDDAL